MSLKPFALLGVLLASGAAFAQAPAIVVGVATDVQGLVTVSNGSTVESVSNNAPILDGSRYVTSSSGSVILHWKNGACEVKLKPNQTILVDNSKDCDRLIAVALPAGSGTVITSGDLAAVLASLVGTALLSPGVGTPPGNPGNNGGQIPDPNFSAQ